MTGSVLLYVQHLLGIGHLRRSLRIAGALRHEGIRVTVVSGGEPLSTIDSVTADRAVQLPPIRAGDSGFQTLVDAAGHPVGEELQSSRRASLLAVFAEENPDALLIEAFPFGRRAFRFELDALIKAASSQRSRPLILCSLRDIVVPPSDPRRPREIVDQVRRDFDFVLVHGDPEFIPLEDSFPLAPEIKDKLIYTGYVAEPCQAGDPDYRGHGPGTEQVLVSAGGGAVGGTLLATAIETRRRGCLVHLEWRLLSGPNLPEPEFAKLAEALPRGVSLERYRPDFPQMLRDCRVSISQAGYNTVLDILQAGAPAVVVPFAAGRETEQNLRAERLAARGVLEMVREEELSPERLASAVARVASKRRAAVAIDTAGTRRSAALIAEMMRRRDREIGLGSW